MPDFSKDRLAGGSGAAAASSSHVDVGAVGCHLPPDRPHKAGALLTAVLAAVTARGGGHLRLCLRNPPSHRGGLARRPPTSMPRRRQRRWAPSPPSVRRPWAGGILPSRHGPTSSSAAVLAAVSCRYAHTSVLVCNVVVGERVNRTGMISHFPVTGVV